MKKVLITGAAGYMGRHVVKEFLDHNYIVYANDLNNKGIDDRATIIDYPIFDGNKDIFNRLGEPDILVHLAWRDGFIHNSNAHMEDLSKHMIFLNNMMAGGLKSISVMGSMHEVGYWEGAIDENTPCNPMSMYGVAKNALRQALLLKRTVMLQCIGYVHIIFMETICGEVPYSRKLYRRQKMGKKNSHLLQEKTSMILSILMNWRNKFIMQVYKIKSRELSMCVLGYRFL